MASKSADERRAQLAGVMVVVAKGKIASPSTGVYLQDGKRGGVPCFRKVGGEETIHRGRDCKPPSAAAEPCAVVWWCGEHRSTENGDTVPTTGWEIAPGREWGDDWEGEWVPDPELSVVLVAPVLGSSSSSVQLLVPLLVLICAVYGAATLSTLGRTFDTLDPGLIQAQVLGFGWVDVLYLSHAVLELVLGCIKLRGRYAHEAPGSRTPRSAMYVRHHACSLLSSALLGWMAWSRGLATGKDGDLFSAVLAVFHGGATLAFTYTWLQGGIPFGKVLVPHLPYAIGFGLHTVLAMGM